MHTDERNYFRITRDLAYHHHFFNHRTVCETKGKDMIKFTVEGREYSYYPQADKFALEIGRYEGSYKTHKIFTYHKMDTIPLHVHAIEEFNNYYVDNGHKKRLTLILNDKKYTITRELTKKW